jgi:ankyrin repeat protein
MNPRFIYSLENYPIPRDEKNDGNTYLINMGHQCPHDDLHVAASRGQINEMSAILERDPDALNRFHSMHGTTPICWALEENKQNAINFLLDRGANVLVTKHPFVIYHPLHFLQLTDACERTEIIGNLFVLTDSWISDTYKQAKVLPHERVVNLLQSIFLLVQHEYYQYTEALEERIKELELILQNFKLSNEIKIVYNIALLRIKHLVFDELVKRTPQARISQALVERALLARRQLELSLEAIPWDIRSEDLSIELYLHANLYTDNSDNRDNIFILCYAIANQLAQGGAANLQAAIHLRKSLLLSSKEEHGAIDVDCMIEVGRAIILLSEIKIKNYSLAALLLVAAFKLVDNTSLNNSYVILDMLTLVEELSPKYIIVIRAKVTSLLLRAKLSSENNRSNVTKRLLAEVIGAQLANSQACVIARQYHADFVKSITKSIVVAEMQRLQAAPKETLDIFKNCIYIILNYESATEDLSLSSYLNTIIHKIMLGFHAKVLQDREIFIPLKVLLEEFLNDVIQCSNNLSVKAVAADFHIKIANIDYAIQLYQNILFDALRFEWGFFQETLLTVEIVTRDVLHNNVLSLSIKELHFYTKELPGKLSLEMIDKFIQSFSQARQFGWLGKIYLLVADKISVENENMFLSISEKSELMQRNQIFKQKMSDISKQIIASSQPTNNDTVVGLQTRGLFALADHPHPSISLNDQIDSMASMVSAMQIGP